MSDHSGGEIVDPDAPPVTPSRPRPRPAGLTGRRAALLAVVLVSLNLRGIISAAGPLAGELRTDLNLSNATFSLLTVIPTLCFSLFAIAAVVIGRRLGTVPALVLSTLILFAGAALRVTGGVTVLLLGTVACGCGIAIGNVLLPGYIKEVFPDRLGMLMGLYSVALAASGAIPPALAVPLSRELGGWRWSLGFWALPVIPALVATLFVVRRRRSPPGAGEEVADAGPGGIRGVLGVLRDPIAVACTVFMGMQGLVYYSLLTWLPTVLRDAGGPPGLGGTVIAVGQVAALPLSFVVPWHAARCRTQTWHGLILVAFYVAAMAGLILRPLAAPYLWSILWGISGTGFPLALTVINLRSPTHHVANRLSAAGQTVGYLIGSAGPLALGVLREATGNWARALIFMLLLAVPLAIASAVAGRPRHIYP